MSDYQEIEVFISYNSHDEIMASSIAKTLRKKGIKVWIATQKLPSGSKWKKELEDAIEKAKVAVVLFGEKGLSGWQETEYYAVLGPNNKIIPVLLPGANKERLPRFLKDSEYVDMRDGIHREKIVELIEGIKLSKSEQSNNDKYQNTPKRFYHKFSTPSEFCYAQNSRFGDRLQINRDAKESIARYCAHVDSEFKWGESVFLQAGSLAAFILFHMYRSSSKNLPKTLITNMLACSAISVEARAQAKSLGELCPGNDKVETHIIEGISMDDFASTMPEELMGMEGKFLDGENKKCSSLVDCIKMKQPDHVVMMATNFTADKGPHSNDTESRRLKKLLMRYIFDNREKETRLSIMFEADKLIIKPKYCKPADSIDLPDGSTERYWTKIVGQRGRVGIFSALTPEMETDDEKNKEYREKAKAELRAVKEMGANPVVLLGTNGDPIPLS